MKLRVKNECSELVSVCVCKGTYIPEFDDYFCNHPEFTKYCHIAWNKELFLNQHQAFLSVLNKYNVELLCATPKPELPWLAYTRDFGFVIGDKLFYCLKRNLPERNGEMQSVLRDIQLDKDQVIEIDVGMIEGGDVLVDDDITYVGLGSRTSSAAVDQLREYVTVKTLKLGESVMHLDTRMTILPNRKLLIYTHAFTTDDLEYLSERFEFIEVTKDECESLGTNVFVINPKTIVVDASHVRVQNELRKAGFTVEVVDYSEPIAISGSFRCTTLPVQRK